ncbi:hypothetical protein M9H77_07013 [Catharanthus roseus]|uniref:Uncharacterized protein n=1 Tax=Catharanthus roseus TaxID=4058 RepID=A0ACC0BU41_CATRO|nr:hypothetical protein M9H77_07013 [Catharanthus roseus]
MESPKDLLQENVGFQANEDRNTFEEFLEQEYVDLGHLLTTDRIFSSKDELVNWAKQTAMKAKTYLIINRYERSRTADRRPYVKLACERRGALKKYTKPIVDYEEEEILIKGGNLMGPKNQVATSENWQSLMHKGRHNHKIVVYHHGHAQAARFIGEQLQQIDAQKIYNVIAKIKKNRMQGRNTVEEVLCLSAQRGYTVFYRNREESNVFSDTVVAQPTSITMIRKWIYVLIMDSTYNMSVFEAVGMTPTGKNFTATTYRWVLQQIKHLHVISAMSNGHNSIVNEGQIAEIKYSLEISKLKEKFAANSNAILKNISIKINHLALKKIWLEIKKAHEMVEDPEKIGADIPDVHERDMDSEMCDLTLTLEEISTGPISKVREVCRLIKGVIYPVLPEDPCPLLTNPQETTVTIGGEVEI